MEKSSATHTCRSAFLTWQVGTYGKSAEHMPRSCSSVLLGGHAFPSPSGAPCGISLVGGGAGRVYLFDAPNSLECASPPAARVARR